MSNFNMGQKVASLPKSQSSCSIISVDEDIQFVVDSGEDSEFSTTVPIDKNIELSRRTYSKKNPVTYPMFSAPSQDSFEFSILPNTQQPGASNVDKRKRKPGVMSNFLQSPIPRKLQKKETTAKYKRPIQTLISKSSRESKYSPKTVFVENEISSDSDIEVIEVKVVNPDGLKLKSLNNYPKKLHINQNSIGDKKKLKDYGEPSKKKGEIKPMLQHASKPCFMTENELVVNEADTAPYMPNNPTLFSDGRGASGSIKWLSANGTLEIPHFDNRSVIRNNSLSLRNIENKSVLLPELKQSPVDKKVRSRELKNLYANLNEIAWTQETSFKNLLRNPDYIRHSERNTGRTVATGKGLRKIKQKAGSKARSLKKSPTVKAGLKKCKLAKLTTTKKLAKLNTNKVNKLNNKLAKIHTNKLTPFNNKVPKLKSTKVSKLNVKNKPSKLNIKSKDLKLKVDPCTVDEKVSIIDTIKQKNSKKQNSVVKVKISPKAKVESPKMKNDVKLKTTPVPKEKPQVVPKAKVEISEASSSGLQDLYSGMSFYHPNQKDGHIGQGAQRDSLDPKAFKFIHEYNRDDRRYTAVRKGSQCRVRIEPLEHSNLWNTEYYEDFRKQVLHQTFRKVIEKREPCIATVLQELCDSYMSPPPPEDTKVSKKKKPEEETLRSSARQIEGAFRYKEIVVKKLQGYMQVILVPNGVKKNCLSIDAIKELRDAFLLAKKDPKCRAVLLNSSGSYFCTGLDLSQLIGPNKKQACEEMASVIKDLVLMLATFTKPVVAAVNGTALGFGVSLLTYCDVVLASDKATFCIPSNAIGYIPEGGLTLMLPQIVGNVWSSEMLLQGTRLTAEQAHQKGLVSEVLWPTKLMNEVIPRMQTIISQPLPVMEATKLLVRANTWEKLKLHMEMERRMLVNHWLSPDCQHNIKKLLHTGLLVE